MRKKTMHARRGNRWRRIKKRQWLLRRQQKLLRRRRRVRRRAPGFRFRTDLPLNEYTRQNVTRDPERKLIITLPERLDFEENYEATASHFAILHQAVRKRTPVRSLRFDQIRYISPSAALVLASEVDRWNQKTGGRLKADVASWNEDIKRLLCEMGYFDLLGLSRPSTTWPKQRLTFLPFKRGGVSDVEGGPLAKRLRIEIETLLGEQIKKHFLFEGLSEAITNVGQHAYHNPSPFTVQQWWMSASFNEDGRELCVTFFDQGEGIPHTLPRAYFFEIMQDVFHTWTDSQKIEAAMETGRTSTRQPQRGKGLQNFLEFARAHRQGQLSIYSLKGMYRKTFVSDGKTQTQESTRRDHKTSIGGTLIEWSVRL